LSDGEFGKNVANLSNQFAATPNRRFQLFKSRQLFIRTHNETLRRRDVRQQSRSFARWNLSLRHSPNSNRLCSDCQRLFPLLIGQLLLLRSTNGNKRPKREPVPKFM
jgi:hypothetical protein